MDKTVYNFAQKFDHTNLNIGASSDDLFNLCSEAIQYNFYSVMVYPFFICDCRMVLHETNVKVGTVVGFPHGRSDLAVKEKEIEVCIEQGAQEIDVVPDRNGLFTDNLDHFEHEVTTLTNICKQGKVPIKFILETCYLDTCQKLNALRVCENAGADFIKTSTGFGTHGAVEEDIILFNKHRTTDIGIKASGGIKTLQDATKMIKAGATRLGTSSSVSIIKEFIDKYENYSNVIEFARK